MRREYRLRKKTDFERVFNQGKSCANRLAVLYYLESRVHKSRAGFVVSKRFGNAVKRNRVKRRYREALRSLWPRVEPGYDIVVLPREAGKEVAFQELVEALGSLLDKSGLLAEE
jgi:ribonuclease P protein component